MSDFLERFPANLQAKIREIIVKVPESENVFREVFHFGQINVNDFADNNKKRKVSSNNSLAVSAGDLIFELQDVSVLSPLRKKLTLTISIEENSQLPMIAFKKNDTIEHIVRDIKNSIKFAAFLPFPEKKNLEYLYIYYEEREGNNNDPILITLNKDQTLKQFKERSILTEEESNFQVVIDYMRRQAILTGFRISDPFSPSVMESHHSFFVDCHRGSKEGSLFFLPEHILFGFKKPILLFESKDIDAITYSSITRLTFNVTLILKNGEKFEFSMIDQNKFSEIDDYVKRKQVQDKSMSDELKAKVTKSSQVVDQSALKEALEESGALDGMNADSDDENDKNFEDESDLSDGSNSSNEEEEEEEEDDEEEEGEEGEEGEDEEEESNDDDQWNSKEKGSGQSSVKDPEQQNIEIDHDLESQQGKSTSTTSSRNNFSMEVDEFPSLLDENELIQDIPISMDDDEEEDSGVEYN
ncbi:hypothetical protein C6P41_004784 [Kluyveromyces marxianus]|nr:hypothetical protein C6P43_001863 [Kluyveromyces marxianus]KAG0685427.1 hypothetical protein C6P41_004784 [Kluyveromyces marxianus]